MVILILTEPTRSYFLLRKKQNVVVYIEIRGAFILVVEWAM